MIEKRPIFLALHGKGSNSQISQIQLNNLISFTKDYDVIYIDGPIKTDQAGPDIARFEDIIDGPWYSWLPDNFTQLNTNDSFEAVYKAVKTVVSAIQENGPFDGVYGFSQGALIANIVNNIAHDPVLLKALNAELSLPLLPTQNLFKTAIYACYAAPMTISDLRQQANLGQLQIQSDTTHQIHLIGRLDPFRARSEEFVHYTATNNSNVFYLPDGHEIGSNLEDYDALKQLVRYSLQSDNNIQKLISFENKEWQSNATLSSRMSAGNRQVVDVRVQTEGMATTILQMLSRQPADAPLLHMARSSNPNTATTYGSVLAFLKPKGYGDLRRLGVKKGEAVAYLAPSGGSAVSALAFLSIASQTCAAPFSASMSQADALLALEQFNVKHMVVFEGVVAQGVIQAFTEYEKLSKAKLHHAYNLNVASVGMFEYQNSIIDFDQSDILENPPDMNSLLLRTSGTTSTPKVVPLQQQELVINAEILADGLGLQPTDVAYSIMPLDHIGGISASILCSVAAGSSITCDNLYTPQTMVEALLESTPRPTWYSAVPTIHTATIKYLQDNADEYLDSNGQFCEHNLRFIRSGAAAIEESDKQNLRDVYGCDVITTYSMSEQMPISQPPLTSKGWLQNVNSVGVPVASSLAIVDPVTLIPLLYGKPGEIAISGDTVFKGYMDNPTANNSSQFLMKINDSQAFKPWFLTGDIGEIDADGMLALKGRLKELIKRGGEQISPAEIEEILVQHPIIDTAICFSVPSELYGEEVGCALVLVEESANESSTSQAIVVQMLRLLRENDLATHKLPSAWKIVLKDELPVTRSKKYKRNGLASVLKVSTENRISESDSSIQARIQNSGKTNSNANSSTITYEQPDKPFLDWEALAGFRFVLACYVMFMHIGSNDSWGAFNNLRQFPWHVHAFFAVAGFSLAIVMPPLIRKRGLFIKSRILGMYPLYGLALLLGLGNLLVTCNPTTFISGFNWSFLLNVPSEPFCQGTPFMHDSWWTNVFSTFIIHATGLQATPLWGGSWFLGFYLWFISMYFQCLIVFPFIYNLLYKNRGNTKTLLKYAIAGLVLNIVIILGFWFGYAIHATGYGVFDAITGLRAIPSLEQVEIAGKENATILSFYLFSPFWIVYFIVGMCAAFLYDAVRPYQSTRVKLWGYVADSITALMIIVSIAHVLQGYHPNGSDILQVSLDTFYMRPDAANSFADPGIVNRIWDNIYARMFAPITILWVFAICTGQGITARLLRFKPLQIMAPTGYACFLFHQMVGQWYYSITRHGDWWNWWNDQKLFYWFSPQPLSVQWYEYFYIVGLVVLFAKMVMPLEAVIKNKATLMLGYIKYSGSNKQDTLETKNTIQEILAIVEGMSGLEAKPEWSLQDCGLASLGIIQFANTLEVEFSTVNYKLRLPVTDIMAANDLIEIAEIVDKTMGLIQQNSGLSRVAA